MAKELTPARLETIKAIFAEDFAAKLPPKQAEYDKAMETEDYDQAEKLSGEIAALKDSYEPPTEEEARKYLDELYCCIKKKGLWHLPLKAGFPSYWKGVSTPSTAVLAMELGREKLTNGYLEIDACKGQLDNLPVLEQLMPMIPKLKELTFNSVGSSSEIDGVALLAKIQDTSSLTKLRFERLGMKDPFGFFPLDLSSLQTLMFVRSCSLGQKGVVNRGEVLARVLEQCPKLTELKMWHTHIGAQGADAFARVLEKNSTLVRLGFYNAELGNQGVEPLARALEKNSTLQSLELGENGIGDQGVETLVRSLEQNSTLTELELDSNRDIGAQGAEALARFCKVQKLNLQSTEIGDQEAEALARGLEHNSTLKELELGYNNISDQGTVALARMLEQNSTLQELKLGSNEKIGDQGAEALARGLEQNSTLQNLILHNNQIGDQGAEALARGLEQNSTLEELVVWGCKISDAAKAKLKAAAGSTFKHLHL